MAKDSNQDRQQRTLEGWKEISAYLQRSLRTAKRWDKEEGLPVHRHTHKNRPSVYAYPHELEAWRARLNVAAESGDVSKAAWRRPLVALLSTTLLAVALLAAGSGPNLEISPVSANSAASGIAVREIWAGPRADAHGSTSPDGRYLSFTDWETGDLAVRDLRTNEIRRLTQKEGGWANYHEFAGASVISPDGTRIAYSWANEEDLGELRVVGIDGSENHEVARTAGRWSYLEPAAWFPDGDRVLTVLDHYRGTNEILVVTLADGQRTSLKALGKHFPDSVVLSQDGAFAAFDVPTGDRHRDIALIRVEDRVEHALVENPADDIPLGWAPGGRSFLFLSDRTGSWDAWLIGVADGKPTGKPILVKRDVGQVRPVGFTSDGSFYFGSEDRGLNVFTTRLDLAGERIEQRPEIAVQRFVGKNLDSRWSPDGRRLAYVSRRGSPPKGATLCIRTVESGADQEIVPEMAWFSPIQWADDGESIYTFGSNLRKREGVYRIDLATGGVELIIPSEDFRHPDMGPRWAIVRKTAYLVRHPKSGKWSELVARDLQTGAERSLGRSAEESWFTGIYPSPDGRSIALRLSRRMNEPLGLLVMPAGGGEPRELLSTGPGVVIRDAAWTPDSQGLLCVEHTVGPPLPEKWEMVSVGVQGGGRKVLGQLTEGKERVSSRPSLSMHPDGRQITFTGHTPDTEIWVMEGFLPEDRE